MAAGVSPFLINTLLAVCYLFIIFTRREAAVIFPPKENDSHYLAEKLRPFVVAAAAAAVFFPQTPFHRPVIWFLRSHDAPLSNLWLNDTRGGKKTTKKNKREKGIWRTIFQ